MMDTQILAYPATVLDEGNDGVTVTFVDLPEAITGAMDLKTALAQASDALDEAIATRMRHREVIPNPSPEGQCPMVCPSMLIGAKAMLYSALKEYGMTQKQLAKQLGVDPREVRRILNPRHGTAIERIEAALAVFGVRPVIGWRTDVGTLSKTTHPGSRAAA